jgi:exonuclease III
VNGLARKLPDPDFIETLQTYDIVLLSETWLSENTHLNLDIQGFVSHHLYGNKTNNTRRGRYSGGLSVYYKEIFGNKISIVEKHQSGIVWLKCCKTMFTIDEDVYICYVYIPPKGSNVHDVNEFDFFENIETGLEKYKPLGTVFVTGDLNSTCSNDPDTLDFDIFLEVDSQLSDFVYTPPRVSVDHVIDTNGRRLLDLCQSASIIIGNGRLHNDRGIGDYTFHSINGSSVVDYLLLGADTIEYISHFEILPTTEFSDHSGISFNIMGNAIYNHPVSGMKIKHL